MIDRGLEVGASFDWISPLAGVLGNLAHGGGYTFLIPACDMTPHEIESALRAKGITTWGAMIVGQTFTLSVKKRDAMLAYNILKGLGVPVENPPPMQAGKKPKRKARAGSPFAVFDDVFRR